MEGYGRGAYPEIHLAWYFQEIFFEKMTDWEHETEWRFVAMAEGDEDLYVKYGDALVGIMFGEETNNLVIDTCMKLTRRSLKYMGLEWKNSSPWYDYNNPKYYSITRVNN